MENKWEEAFNVFFAFLFGAIVFVAPIAAVVFIILYVLGVV